MSSTIEVLKQYKEMALKRYNEEGFIPDKSFAAALDEAIVKMEKLDRLEKWVEKEIERLERASSITPLKSATSLVRNGKILGLKEVKDKMEENILSAKRCLEFGLRRCDCLNEACPLNKKYDKKELKGVGGDE